MIRSLRFTLTLWYVGILGLTLSVFGMVLYRNVSFNLKKDIDHFLTAEADGINEAIFSFWAAEVGHKKNNRDLAEKKFTEIKSEDLAGLINRWSETADELYAARPVRFLAPKGETLAFSTSMTRFVLPVTQKAVVRAGKGKIVFETFRSPEQRVRVMTCPVSKKGKLLYLIQAAVSLHQADLSLRRLRSWLVLLIPLTLVLTCVIGWFLGSLALSPVGKMTSQAKRISATRLYERIDVPRTGDELELLAETFNELLNRFEKGFKRLRQFSAAASHELRTPLTVLKGEMEWVLRKPRPEGDYPKVFQAQLNVVNEMIQIVEQLLAVAHSEEGEWAVDWKPVELSKVVPWVCESYLKIAAQQNVSLQKNVSDGVWIQGERGLLERLISNLLENALKHTPSSGQVRVTLKKNEKEAVLTVEDTGSGVPPHELPRIFDKFFVHKPSGQDGKSTGIGLGLCRWIAEAHQGRIDVASPSSKGAIFTVILPLHPPA